MRLTWPDLQLPPINLWSAPWLGRKYEEFQRQPQQPAQTTTQYAPVCSEQIRALTQYR